MDASSDEQLISSYLDGQEDALEILINKHLNHVYNFVFKYVSNKADAQDITQETFIKAWRNLKKFDPEKRFTTWLFQIAKNTSIDYLRKKKTIPFSILQEKGFLNDIPDQRSTGHLEKISLSDTISRALNQLKEKYQTVLILRYNNGLTFQEMASSLNQSINTVKSQHRRALIMLRQIIGKE